MSETVKEQRHRKRVEERTELIRRRESNNALLNEFQPDAVEIEHRSVPGGARWTLYTVVALMIAVVAWSSWAEVDRIVTAQGKLITTQPDVIIQTVATAPIRTMLARFGDHVNAGDVLATLDPTFSAADLKQLRSKSAGLQCKIARMTAEKDGEDFSIAGHEDSPEWLLQRQVFVERKNEYAAKLNEFEADAAKITIQRQNNLVEIDQKKAAYEDYRAYENTIKRLAERGSKSTEDMLSRRLQTNQAKTEYIGLRSRSRELVQEVDTLSARRKLYEAQWRSELVSELTSATQELGQTGEELSKAVRSNELVELKVPEDLPFKRFVVFEVADRSVGSVLSPGEPLFRLVPIDVPLEVEVEIEGRDISKIRAASPEEMAEAMRALSSDQEPELPEGSRVSVKLASFPFQKHGTLEGVVRTISEGSFEKTSAGGASTGVTMYKARIRLEDSVTLDDVPDNFRLMPGMTTTAEIKVGRRRVIEYFLYPLLRYQSESIREP